MSTQVSSTNPANPPEFRIFLEFVLMIGLPLMAVFAGCLLAFNAYVHGFTQLPNAAPAAVPVHVR